MTQLPPVLAALGWTLLHMVWQGGLVALAYALARVGLRRSTPAVRHGAALAALLLLALLPLATFLAIWATPPVVPDPARSPIAMHGADPVQSDGWIAIVPTAMPWLLAIWGLGVGALATRSAIGWNRLRRLVRTGTRALDPAWQRRIETLKTRLGLTAAIRIFSTDAVSSPIVTGCFRPVVLVPLSALTGLPPEQLEALILHELVHIKRWDLWVHRLQFFLETLFFYHPAVWWVSRTLNDERESCCDATVIAVTGDRFGYARALAGMESIRSGYPQPALAASGGSLMSRIRNILNPAPSTSRSPLSTAAWSLPALGLAVALVATTSVIGDTTRMLTPLWMPQSVTQWSSEFEEASKRHGVDPTLLSIVTLVESRGDAEAISSWGAIGLMQIMPNTGKKIAEIRGIDGFTVDDLHDPATNIDFGAWYLAEQIEAFGDGQLSDRTVARVAAAYNGGPKRMRRHLEEGMDLSDESQRYSEIVEQLWAERGETRSKTFERITGGQR